MKKNTKTLLIILGIILAWAIFSGTIDLGLFTATSVPDGISSSGGIGGIAK